MTARRQHQHALAGAVVACLAAAASAVHLAGPMNDKMVACGMANCPEFMALMSPTSGNVQGTGLPLSSFLAPPLNAVPFIYSQEYALNVMGFTDDGNRVPGTFNYRATPNSPDNPVPQNLIAGGANATDDTGSFSCMCQHCGAMVEAIFQPVGRAACTAVGFDLPCQTQFDDCQAATPDGRPAGYAGSAEYFNITYPTLMPFQDASGWLSQSDPCQPEATFGAYKAAYNLETQCAVGATALTNGGTAEALDLATCVAESRIGVYASEEYGGMVSCGDVDISGPDCGLPYPTDSCAPPEPEPEPAASPSATPPPTTTTNAAAHATTVVSATAAALALLAVM